MTSNSGLPEFYATTRQGEAPRDLRPQPGILDRFFSFQSTCGMTNDGKNPGLVPQAGYGNSPGGCGIDTQSSLLWGDAGTTREKGPKQMFARPFATTPFLGMGSIENIPDQSKVMFGHSTANRKSIQTVTDKMFPVFEPLIPEREADIPDHNYFVEPFLRGGQASRQIPRIRVDLTK